MRGHVDAFNERHVLETFKPHFERPGRLMVLDLAYCESVNLKFLRELVRWSQALRDNGGELILMNGSVAVRRMIEIFVGPDRIRYISSLAELTLNEVYGPDRLQNNRPSKVWPATP